MTWDGTDQKGHGVPLGKFNIWVEVTSQNGPYAARYEFITLGNDPAEAKISATEAFSDVIINYGPGVKR
jgi:flagellar hook assembly protein FlgD